MGRTLIQVITKIAEITDPKHFFSGTTDASGNLVGAILDADLARFNNKAIVGKSLYWTSGTPSPDSTIVTDFTQSTGKALIRPDLAAAPDSEAFLVLPYRKQMIEDAIADAIYELYETGELVREVLMYGFVAGSPIYNAGFDYWTSATTPDGWAANGSATLAKEVAGANTFNSRQSLKVSGSADYVTQSEPWKSWLEDFKGGSLRFYCPALASNASHARIAIYDGSTTTYSDYHTGGGAREILDTGSVEISPTATDLEVRLYNDDTNAVYFGDCWVEGAHAGVRELPVMLDFAPEIAIVEALSNSKPDSTTQGRYRHMGRGQTIYQFTVSQHSDHELSTRFGIMEFVGATRPANGVRLKVTASGQLSVPSADTGIIEVTRVQELIVANLAAAILLERDALQRSDAVASDLRAQAFDFRSKVAELAQGGNKPVPTLERSM